MLATTFDSGCDMTVLIAHRGDMIAGRTMCIPCVGDMHVQPWWRRVEADRGNKREAVEYTREPSFLRSDPTVFPALCSDLYEPHQRAPMLLASSWSQTNCSNIKLERRQEETRVFIPQAPSLRGNFRLGYVLHWRSLPHWTVAFCTRQLPPILVTSSFPIPSGCKTANNFHYFKLQVYCISPWGSTYTLPTLWKIAPFLFIIYPYLKVSPLSEKDMMDPKSDTHRLEIYY